MLASFFIVGVFFVYGYLARLARNVIAGVQHPLPEWDDLGDFFSEGLRLFGVGFVYMLPMIASCSSSSCRRSSRGATDNEAFRNIGGGMAACVWCLIFPLGLALAIWLPARAAVRGRWSSASARRSSSGRSGPSSKANVGNYLLALRRLARRADASCRSASSCCCVGVVFTGFWSLVVATYAFAQA